MTESQNVEYNESWRDEYLKWYQTIFISQYGWVEKKSDYSEKLARVIKQNNKE